MPVAQIITTFKQFAKNAKEAEAVRLAMDDDRRLFARLGYSVPLNFKICSKETISRLCEGIR
jgi:hypothetical protein